MPEKLEKHRKRLGCFGDTDPGLVYKPTYDMTGWPKIVYSKCIGNFFDYRAMELIRYHSKFKDGIYPYHGSYYEQPAKFVEVMDLVQNLIMQKQSEMKATLSKYKRK